MGALSSWSSSAGRRSRAACRRPRRRRPWPAVRRDRRIDRGGRRPRRATPPGRLRGRSPRGGSLRRSLTRVSPNATPVPCLAPHGSAHHGGAGEPPRRISLLAAATPAVALRRGTATALRRPGRDRGLRPALAGRPGRRSMGGGDLAHRGRGPRAWARSRTSWSSRSWPGPGRPNWSAGSASTWSVRPCWPTGPRNSGPGSSPASCRPRSSGASSSASPTPAAIWPRSPPGPCRSTAATSSPAARSGRPTPSSPTGACAWPASDPDAPKRQLGITALIVDMHADGVVVHPLVQSTGEAEFNEVELDEVFVPADRRVGDEGRGWAVAGLHPGPRARRQPPPAGHPLAADRGAAARWPRPTAASTTGGCASNWPRPPPRSASSSSTTGGR